MNAKEVLKITLNTSMRVLKMYLEDLSDSDLLLRTTPNANHVAWQIGHLIVSEANIPRQIPSAKLTELPAGFAPRYTKATANNDSPADFDKKADLMALYDRVRINTFATLDSLSEADLDVKTTGPMARLMPNYGALFNLLALHAMMHAGQVTSLRRLLGKPVLF